jgi:pimeloyl-ACP methyl ester carboxylesterase
MLAALIFLIPALLWACTRFASRAVERRYPPHGRFLEVEGGRLHYTVAGEGYPLILLHGASASGQDFEASIVSDLAGDFQVIVPDRPGLGYSTRRTDHWPTPLEQANSVRELVREMGLHRPVLVAHSWSGALALSYLLHYPREALGMVLLSPAAHSWHAPPAIHNRVSRWPLLGAAFVHLLVFPLGYIGLDGGIRSVFHRGRVPPDYRRKTGAELLLRPSSWRANADDLCLLNEYLASQGPTYRWIRHPAMAIIGDHDSVVSNEIHTIGLKRQIPGMSVICLAECGHAPHHEYPDTVCRLIREFIGTLSITSN